MIGASGFASEVTQYIEDNNKYKILGYFDINKDEYNKYDFKSPYLGSENDFDFNKGDEIIISISDTKLKSKIYTKLKERGLKFPIFIHKNTFVSKNSRYKKRIAHGLMAASYFSALFGTKIPGEGCVYVSQSLNFKIPVYIGDTVTAIVEVINVDLVKKIVFFRTICKVKNKVVTDGEAELFIP